MLELKEKTYLTKKERVFLTEYALSFHKKNSMKASNLHLDKEGNELSHPAILRRANQILKMKISQEYLTEIHKEIFHRNVHTIEKAVNETYEYYEDLRFQKYHNQANIAYQRYCDLLGFSKNSYVLNQQFNTGTEGGITINYIIPKEENNNNDSK